MMNELIREATTEEMAIYNKVNDILLNIEDDDADNFTEIISNVVFAFRCEREEAYKKANEMVQNFGLTVEECITWFCIDED